jgi:cystathionine gamma-synthase
MLPEGASRPLGGAIQPAVAHVAGDPDALDAIYEGRERGYTYAREGHVNADALAARIDAMEGAPEGQRGWITGSGMAAVAAAVLGLVKKGGHVLGADQLYGRSLRLLSQDLPRMGLSASLADATDGAAFAAAIRPETQLILIEVVSNPTLRVADVAAIIDAARARGVPVAIDNTFTTPAAFRAFAEGADIVIHSVTKLLSGHSDATLGYVAARDPARMQAIRDFAITTGMTPSPFDCWLAERGAMTFPLRFERAEANARALADHLAGLGGVTRVIYPGRADHPDHNRAAGLLGAHPGNMLSFEIAGGRAAANALVRAMPEVAFAPTLGDIGTTLSHPASSSHRGLGPEGRAALGISEGFFRVSVGIEDADALCESFSAGVAAARRA